jgi:hypothetical protein
VWLGVAQLLIFSNVGLQGISGGEFVNFNYGCSDIFILVL